MEGILAVYLIQFMGDFQPLDGVIECSPHFVSRSIMTDLILTTSPNL
jgi:hypothetical protein